MTKEVITKPIERAYASIDHCIQDLMDVLMVKQNEQDYGDRVDRSVISDAIHIEDTLECLTALRHGETRRDLWKRIALNSCPREIRDDFKKVRALFDFNITDMGAYFVLGGRVYAEVGSTLRFGEALHENFDDSGFAQDLAIKYAKHLARKALPSGVK